MRLKLYRAASTAEAMARVRAELGPEALILATRRVGQGIEVTAALEPEEDIAPLPLPPDPARAAALAWHGVPEALAAALAQGELDHALAATLAFATLPLAAPRRAAAAGRAARRGQDAHRRPPGHPAGDGRHRPARHHR